jgi:NAD(P)-dependent dehydrogenase (short-subunit alcohol dehydrogenase family)
MVFPSFDLAGQVALVTGAARGLGNAVSLALAHAGTARCVFNQNYGRFRAALIVKLDLRTSYVERFVNAAQCRDRSECGALHVNPTNRRA